MFPRHALAVLRVLTAAGLAAGCSQDTPRDTPRGVVSDAPRAARSTSVESPPPIAAALRSAAPAPSGPAAAPRRAFTLAVFVPGQVDTAARARARKIVEGAASGLKVLVDQPGDVPPGSLALRSSEGKQDLSHVRALRQNVRGLVPRELDAIADYRGALWLRWVLEGEAADTRTREAYEMAGAVATALEGVVMDSPSLLLYGRGAWREERVATWEGSLPEARRHFKIDYEPLGDRKRAATRGMLSLGLPDLVIADLPLPQAPRGQALIEGVAQLLAEGLPIGAGGRLEIDLRAIRHSGARVGVVRREHAPGILVADLVVAEPHRDDPENRMYELRFSKHPGATETERLTSALGVAFGPAIDPTTRLRDDDPELAALARKVQGQLPALQARFARGVPQGEHLSVKVPFEVDGGGATERMWIVVTSWKGTTLHGTLDSEPQAVARLRAGAHLDVRAADVTDFAWWKADGTRDGGESIDLLRRRQAP